MNCSILKYFPDTCLTCISAPADDTILQIVPYIFSFNTYDGLLLQLFYDFINSQAVVSLQTDSVSL